MVGLVDGARYTRGMRGNRPGASVALAGLLAIALALACGGDRPEATPTPDATSVATPEAPATPEATPTATAMPTATPTPTPEPVPGPRALSVTTGEGHACALTEDGAVVCWGENAYGETDAPEGTYIDVSAGWNHTCAIRITRVANWRRQPAPTSL